jgi:hypothetical protein
VTKEGTGGPLAAGGKTGGFSANGGIRAKLRLLSIEGAKLGEAPALFDDLPLLPGRVHRYFAMTPRRPPAMRAATSSRIRGNAIPPGETR